MANLTDLVNAANQQFIDQFVVAQNNAITLGQTGVYLTTFQHCNIKTLMDYFVNLGYYVTFPDFAPLNGSQPGELFGPAWIAYWESQIIPGPNGTVPHNPTRMGIAWVPPFTPPQEPV
jgi:hypothetical protein